MRRIPSRLHDWFAVRTGEGVGPGASARDLSHTINKFIHLAGTGFFPAWGSST
ncbi:MAG: hypothetical protein WBB69_15945 [Anaerolineales bacterium]